MSIIIFLTIEVLSDIIRFCINGTTKEKNMNYILLCLTIIATPSYYIIRNYLSKKCVRNKSDFYYLNTIFSIVSTIALVIVAAVTKASLPSAYTVVMGLLFGVLTALVTIFNMYALECGPMSYTSLIMTAAMIFPALSGYFFFSESLGTFKITGMIIMLFSLFLSVYNKNGNEKKANKKWFVFSILTMICNGSIGIMQKIHQSSVHRGELLYFLIIAFVFSAVYSFICLLFFEKNKKFTAKPHKIFSPVFWLTVLSGFLIAVSNLINLYLSGVMNSIIFFPILNGANLFILIFASSVLFKEKLSLTKWIGIIIGCAAIALLCL